MLAIFGAVVVGIFVFVGVGIFIFAKIAADSVDDTSALTEQVTASVLSSDEHQLANHHAGYHVVYRYAADGQQWKSDGYVNTGTWRPGKNLVLCVDPDHPAHNSIVNTWVHACGDSDLPNGIDTAAAADAATP